MPLYEYRCRACGHRFEVLQRMGESGDGLACPRCGGERPDRQFSTFAAGSGGTAAAAASGCGAGACGGGGGFT